MQHTVHLFTSFFSLPLNCFFRYFTGSTHFWKSMRACMFECIILYEYTQQWVSVCVCVYVHYTECLNSKQQHINVSINRTAFPSLKSTSKHRDQRRVAVTIKDKTNRNNFTRKTWKRCMYTIYSCHYSNYHFKKKNRLIIKEKKLHWKVTAKWKIIIPIYQ